MRAFSKLCVAMTLASLTTALGAAAERQPSPADGWPDITKEERELAQVIQDPEADAVVLLKQRHGRIVRKGDDTVNALSYHWRLKILNDRGKRFGVVRIPAQKHSRVSEIEARTITTDGTVLPVTKDQIFEKVLRQVGRLKWTAWVFNFPAVEPGAILEYRYVRNDENVLFIEPWFFDDQEFTLRSVVSQAVPRDMIYALRRQNAGNAQVVVSDWREGPIKGRTYSLELHDLPGFRDEILMPPRREASPRMEMVLEAWRSRYSEALGRVDRFFVDWASVAKHAGYYYQEANKKGLSALRPEVEAWVRGIADPQGRIKAVLRHVRQDFTYVPWDTVIGESRTIEEILRDRSADNEEKAVLLAAALKAIDIESKIALVCGRDKGTLNSDFFSLSQFTHAIVALEGPDGTHRWLDPTVTHAPDVFMPWRDMGAGVLLLGKDRGEIITLPVQEESNASVYRVMVRPHADGRADVDVEVEYLGEDAIGMRSELAPTAESARLAYLQKWVADRSPGAILTSYDIENLGKPEEPLRIKMSLEVPGIVTLGDGVLLVRGCVLTCLENNPVSRATRQHPFYANFGRTETEVVTLQPPSAFGSSQVPPTVTARSVLGALVFACMSQDDGAVRCSRQFVTHRGAWRANVQEDIRAMFDKIIEADRTAIAFEAGASTEAN